MLGLTNEVSRPYAAAMHDGMITDPNIFTVVLSFASIRQAHGHGRSSKGSPT